MKSRSSIYIITIATLLGIFFGNALGGTLVEFFNAEAVGEWWVGPLGAIILGAIAAGAAWYATSRHEAEEATTAGYSTHVEDPKFARFLFSDTRAGALWLPLRVFIGIEWLAAGWHKFTDPKWMDTGESLLGYWTRAAAIPETGRPVISYDWWRGFIQSLIDSEAHIWFSKVIIFGEILVGLGLIFGALVGIAAFGGALMNMSFLLSGSTSSNPIMLAAAFFLVLGWKVAGSVGLDRYLLRALGTPWQGGTIFRHAVQPAPTA
jgi:thiosulfate dehydrogenase [quinone] large subunit